MEEPVASPPHFWSFVTDAVPRTSQEFGAVNTIQRGGLREAQHPLNKKKTVSITLTLDRER